ncbi:unnamed protein product, partial [Prorocentrum cordatum]
MGPERAPGQAGGPAAPRQQGAAVLPEIAALMGWGGASDQAWDPPASPRSGATGLPEIDAALQAHEARIGEMLSARSAASCHSEGRDVAFEQTYWMEQLGNSWQQLMRELRQHFDGALLQELLRNSEETLAQCTGVRSDVEAVRGQLEELRGREERRRAPPEELGPSALGQIAEALRGVVQEELVAQRRAVQEGQGPLVAAGLDGAAKLQEEPGQARGEGPPAAAPPRPATSRGPAPLKPRAPAGARAQAEVQRSEEAAPGGDGGRCEPSVVFCVGPELKSPGHSGAGADHSPGCRPACISTGASGRVAPPRCRLPSMGPWAPEDTLA